MSIADKLTASKNALASLLSFANAKTGKSDINIGDAIKTLCDGYGQGGGDIELAKEVVGVGDIIKNQYISNGVEKTYEGWSISKFYPCSNGDLLIINSSTSNRYSSICDENFNHIDTYSLSTKGIVIYTEGAAFIRFSNTSNEINNLRVARINWEE